MRFPMSKQPIYWGTFVVRDRFGNYVGLRNCDADAIAEVHKQKGDEFGRPTYMEIGVDNAMAHSA